MWSLCLWFIVLFMAICIKIFFKLRVKYNDCYACLVGRTAVVTGANTGIGYITALDFAKRGCRVILACRNKVKAESAVTKIIRETGNRNVIYKCIDLSSLESVRNFAKDFNESEHRLDILVNNAGGIGFDNKMSDDGLQLILQINHVGPFLLTHLLLDKLIKSGSSRIVNVASLAGRLAGKVDLNSLNKDSKYSSSFYSLIQMYENTKACNILFTIELSKRLQQTKVTTNALHPGCINTDFLLTFPIFKGFTRLLGKLYFKTPLEGAQTTIHVALSNKLEGISGRLFDNCREINMYPNVSNTSLAKKLWVLSEEWAQLKENEKISYC